MGSKNLQLSDAFAVNFNCFFLGGLPILNNDMHNYCSVCGYADLPCPLHLPYLTGRRPSVAAAPPKVHCQTPVCCRSRRCGGAPWARRRPGPRLLFSNQTKSQDINYALRALYLYRSSQRSPRLHDHCNSLLSSLFYCASTGKRGQLCAAALSAAAACCLQAAHHALRLSSGKLNFNP